MGKELGLRITKTLQKRGMTQKELASRIGVTEAVISRYLSKELKTIVAHAPAFSEIEILKEISNPKVASENISSTYLPCILMGLAKAPKLDFTCQKGIKNKDIEALILPKNAYGGIAPISAMENDIKIISVDNKTSSIIGCEDIEASAIIKYNSYEECLSSLLKD